jgi:hypothetical protein
MRRTWTPGTSSLGRSTRTTIVYDGEHVTCEPSTGPAKRAPAATVFTQGAYFETDDPRTRLELLRAIAADLDPARMAHPIDGPRRAFLRAFDPGRVAVERIAYVRQPAGYEHPHGFVWRIGPDGISVTRGGPPEVTWDETHELSYVAGPPTPHAPAWHRRALRTALADALDSAAVEGVLPGFDLVRYDKIPPQDLTYDPRHHGESFAVLRPGSLLVGYQYAQDYGTDTFVPERVLSEPWSTRNHLGLPAPILAKVRAALRDAGHETDPAPLSDAARDEALRAALAAQVGPRGPCAAEITLTGFDAVAHERQWTERAALGLFASLAPERALHAPVPVPSSGPSDTAPPALYASLEGAFVQREIARVGGTPDVHGVRWQVAPTPTLRASFVLPPRGAGGTVRLEVHAEDPAALGALRAHCLAYLRALGLMPEAP